MDEDDLDVNVVNDRGDYRLVLFTDASSQVQNNGPLFQSNHEYWVQLLTTVSLFQSSRQVMSHIFADSPSREPPTGRRRDILNQKYDHIGVCLDAILSRAEKGLEEVRIAVAEAREAVEQRRHLILRNNVDEDDLLLS